MTTNRFENMARSGWVRTVQSKITAAEADLLWLVVSNPKAPCDTWPPKKRKSVALTTLRRKKLVRRIYFPTRYVLTRTGLQVVQQLRAALEHSNSKSETSAA